MRDLDPALYTIAWIAPLEVEAQAALHMLDNRHNGRFPMSRGDDYVFLAGDINGHNIVIATLPAGQEYGTNSAAAIASQIKSFFRNLWFGLLVGVAAGLPNLEKKPPVDIRLGDVIVGLPNGESAGLIAYDLGKETADGFELLRFGHILATTETAVRSAIGNIKMMAPSDTEMFLPFYDSIKDKEHLNGTFADPGEEKDILYLTNSEGVEKPAHRSKRDAHRRTRVWYGSIGSGDKLTKNARKRDELRDRYGLIGLEMEAAGTMNRIPVGVIRGVCDYADEHKNKEWQPYAAAMAAAFAKAVLHEIGPGKAGLRQGRLNHAIQGLIFGDLPLNTERFFGREAELSELSLALEPLGKAKENIPQRKGVGSRRKGVVLCGMSGSGKTQVALEYLARRKSNFSAIVWIDASSDGSIDYSMSFCADRICEEVPEFRTRRESLSPKSLVFEWLRIKAERDWLVVIDNANSPIPNRRLLGPLQEMQHGALCVISTHLVVTRALHIKGMIIERLDLAASQSLILWKAFNDDREHVKEVHDAARRIAKLLDGFPLALELVGNLHQQGITSLVDFSTSFTSQYPDLGQFEIDSTAWTWTKPEATGSLFDILDKLYLSLLDYDKQSALLLTLCTIYGPVNIPVSLLHNLTLFDMSTGSEHASDREQLQKLVNNRMKLNRSIDELGKVFLATKKQATDQELLGLSLHTSICHWRLATLERSQRDFWIIQASFGLAQHIQFLGAGTNSARTSVLEGKATDGARRFFTMFDRCLNSIWEHINQNDLEPLQGKFATPYFTICSCGADIYLSLGKLQTAKTLFTSAIEYVRQTQDPNESNLLPLLSGLAKCHEKNKELETAEEVMLSALDIAEVAFGQDDQRTTILTFRLRGIRHRLAVDFDNRERARIAGTGPKLHLTPHESADEGPSRSVADLTTDLPTGLSTPQPHYPETASSNRCITPIDLSRTRPPLEMSWGILLDEAVIFLAGPEKSNTLWGIQEQLSNIVRGRITVQTYEDTELESLSLTLEGAGVTSWEAKQPYFRTPQERSEKDEEEESEVEEDKGKGHQTVENSGNGNEDETEKTETSRSQTRVIIGPLKRYWSEIEGLEYTWRSRHFDSVFQHHQELDLLNIKRSRRNSSDMIKGVRLCDRPQTADDPVHGRGSSHSDYGTTAGTGAAGDASVEKKELQSDNLHLTPGCYDYPFEMVIDSEWPESVQAAHGTVTWKVEATLTLPGRRYLTLTKAISIVRIPPQLIPAAICSRPASIACGNRLTSAQKHRVSSSYGDVIIKVDLPSPTCVVGGKIPIRVNISPLGPDLQVTSLRYSIAEEAKYWTLDGKESHEPPVHNIVLLEQFAKTSSIMPSRRRNLNISNRATTIAGLSQPSGVNIIDVSEARNTDVLSVAEFKAKYTDQQDEVDSSITEDSDGSTWTWLETEQDLPFLPENVPRYFDTDLLLPRCMDMKKQFGRQIVHANCEMPCMQVKHFIQVDVGGTRSSTDNDGTRIEWDVTDRVSIELVDCRINHLPGLLPNILRSDCVTQNNTESCCYCEGSEEFFKASFDNGWTVPGLLTTKCLEVETSKSVAETFSQTGEECKERSLQLGKYWKNLYQRTKDPASVKSPLSKADEALPLWAKHLDDLEDDSGPRYLVIGPSDRRVLRRFSFKPREDSISI